MTTNSDGGGGGGTGTCSEESVTLCKNALQSKCDEPICECDANGDLSGSSCPVVSAAADTTCRFASLVVASLLSAALL